MVINANHLCYRNVECLDALFKQLDIAIFGCGNDEVRRTAMLQRSRRTHQSWMVCDDHTVGADDAPTMSDDLAVTGDLDDEEDKARDQEWLEDVDAEQDARKKRAWRD